MKHTLHPDKIRARMNKLSPKSRRPHVSQAPWAGFSPHDGPRETPLAVCPSPHCRRAKACLAALDNLYCQRTHFSAAEQKKQQRHDPYQRAVAAVPEVVGRYNFGDQMERINELAALRRDYTQDMTARWKAGAFDQLYGPYRAKGVLMLPPPRVYVEEGPGKLIKSP